ncbi:MAG: heparinase II/III domain-containing protein [Armatimonadota bacterium]
MIILLAIGILAVCANADTLSSNRPSVLLNTEQITRIREEIKTIPWKSNLYLNGHSLDSTYTSITSVKQNADHWLIKDITIPSRSGHYHHFFCECGSVLKFPADDIPDPNGYPCTACFKVYKGDKYDGAVRWKHHNNLAYAAFALSLAYTIEGDGKYAAKAREILLKYADAYPGPHTTATEGGIMYQSLCEAVWSIPLATAYDLIFDYLTADERQKIEDKLLKQIGKGMMSVGGAGSGNWGSWHLSAAGVIGYAIKDQKLINYGINNFKEQISKELGDDGLWPESVHTYHFYPLNAFIFLAQAAANSGDDLFNWEAKPGKGLKSMFTAPLSYMYPTQQLPAINDGWFKSFIPLGMYELAYSRYDDPVMGWALKEGYNIRDVKRIGTWALLFGKDLEADIPDPQLKSTNFPGLGISILRSPGGSMMTFDYGPFLGHGQLDKMGITLFAKNKLLAADYGTPGYGSDILKWYVNTPAHNTVVVDGKSQSATSERTQTLFHTGDLLDVSQSQTEQAYPGVLHERTVIRAGESFIFIDRLKSDTDHTYDWFLRCEGDLSVALRRDESTAEPVQYDYVDEEARYSPKGNWQSKWIFDGVTLSCYMFSASPSILVRANCPGESAAKKIPLLINRKTGKESVFISVLIPDNSSDNIECSMENRLVRIEHGDTTDWIFIGENRDNFRLSTDGEFAMVRLINESPAASEVVSGKYVSWKE